MTIELTASPNPLLEIRITQTHGGVSSFAQDDPVLVRRVLDAFHPHRLFTVPLLTLGGDGALTVFPTAHIERVDLIGTGLPTWPFVGGAIAVRERTEEKFRAAYNPARSAAERRKAGEEPGTAQTGFTECWTVSGQRLFWEVQMESRPMTPVDFAPFIQTLFSVGGLHAQTEEGGVVVINPAAITRMVFRPGPPVLPTNAWPAYRLR